MLALSPGRRAHPRPEPLHPPHIHDQAAVEHALLDEGADHFAEVQNLLHGGVVGAGCLWVELVVEQQP